MRIERIDSMERVREIESDWMELLQSSPAHDFFMLPLWFTAWWEVFGREGEMCLLAGWEDDKLTLLLPFYAYPKGPFRIRTFMGLPSHSDRMDVLLAPGREDEAVSALVDWFLDSPGWDLLAFLNFGPFTDTPDRLARLAAKTGLTVITRPDQSCAYIPLTEYADFKDYLVRMHQKRRVHRCRNRLTSHGDFEWVDVTRLDGRILDEMERLDRDRSVRGAMGKNFFKDPMNRRLLESVDRHMGERDLIRLFTLRIKGELSAYILHFSYLGRLMGYQTAYDRDLTKLSVGTLTFAYSIEHAFLNGFSEYDFLLGDESYKNMWTEQGRQNVRLLVYNRGVRAMLLNLYETRGKPLKKRLKTTPLVRYLNGPRTPKPVADES